MTEKTPESTSSSLVDSSPRNTPTPWKAEPFRVEKNLEANCGIYSEQYPGHAYAVARCPRYEKKARWDANAAFIVKACNAYERDQEGIKILREFYEMSKGASESGCTYEPGSCWDRLDKFFG